MHLARALRLGSEPRLAFVGAGGKTTALFCLGRELVGEGQEPAASSIHSRKSKLGESGYAKTVLLTATTHLAVEQTAWADHHFVIRSAEDLKKLGASLPEGVVLLTGPLAESDRTAGLDDSMLDGVLAVANAYRLPLLIEADGSRRRPLKAPAQHEPVIPSWVDTVVVVAGLSAIGQPLTSEWVHRPELFAALTGLQPGALIAPQALQRFLVSPLGGLKEIPATARPVVLLNQADTAERQAMGYRLTTSLLGEYDSVLIAALSPSAEAASAHKRVHAVHERTAGIILAAGASTRLGQSKQVLLWRGQSLVRHAARAALDAGLSPVVLVTGFSTDEVRGAVEDLPLVNAHNPAWEEGQSTSLIAGLKALPAKNCAAVFLLADQPQVSSELIRRLVEQHARTLDSIIAPRVGDKRGNPVLFDRRTFSPLLSLTGDTGGRGIFSRYPISWMPWLDTAILLDIDTMDDYRRLVKS